MTLVEFVGCCWGRDGVGEFGWVDGGGAGEAFAGYVVDVEQWAGEASDFDVFDDGVFDVCEEDAFGAGAGDVFQGEAFKRFVRVNAGAVDEDGGVVDFDVGEAEIFDGGDAFVAGDGVFAGDAGGEDVEAKEAADVAG